jgi:hypothetical protein
MKDIPEYKDLELEDRKSAYEKFVRRQQVSIRIQSELVHTDIVGKAPRGDGRGYQ